MEIKVIKDFKLKGLPVVVKSGSVIDTTPEAAGELVKNGQAVIRGTAVEKAVIEPKEKRAEPKALVEPKTSAKPGVKNK